MAAVLLLALALGAAQPVEYIRERGSGTLTITPAVDGTKEFRISTIGAAGHMCELDGTLTGNIGKQKQYDPSDPECRITVTQKGGMLEVDSPTMEACSEGCGARATFYGNYYLPPPACKPGASRHTKDAFLSQYKARNYVQAYDTLNEWFGQCEHLMFWVDVDKTLNDLALTQYHMNQPASCMATLAKTYAARKQSMEDVQMGLPNVDYESYASIAKATFHNLKLCRK